MTEEEKQAAALEETTATADDGTIDDAAPDGTTETSTSDESTSETDEQAASREAHFQKLHAAKEQELKETMDRLDSLDGSGRLTRIARGQEQAQPTVAETEAIVGDMTVAELNATIAKAVAGPVTEAQRQAEFGTQYNNNLDGAIAELNQFNAKHGIDGKDSASVLEGLKRDYGMTLMHEQDANGQYGTHTPAQLVKLYVREQTARGATTVKTTKTAEVKAAAAAKIEAAQKLSQPSGGSLGEPRDMTEDNKLLEQMRKLGSSEGSEKFWDDK